jgi:hypothetical protein
VRFEQAAVDCAHELSVQQVPEDHREVGKRRESRVVSQNQQGDGHDVAEEAVGEDVAVEKAEPAGGDAQCRPFQQWHENPLENPDVPG